MAYKYFVLARNITVPLASLVVVSCDRGSATQTDTSRDTMTVSQRLATHGDTGSMHATGTPLDSADFIVAGLAEGADSAAVVARLGRPDSVSTDVNQYDAGAKLWTLHYRAIDVDFVVASVQSFEILGPGVSTARGIRIGSTIDEMNAAYGKPSSKDEEDWTYLDPKHDLHQIAFSVRNGRVSKVFIGTGLD
jgi:hypothetical protein